MFIIRIADTFIMVLFLFQFNSLETFLSFITLTIVIIYTFVGPQLPPSTTNQPRKKRKSVEEAENTEELEIEMVTQDEVDWNKAFFSESSDEESQIDSDDPDWWNWMSSIWND